MRLITHDLVQLYDGEPVPERPSWSNFVRFAAFLRAPSSLYWKTHLSGVQQPKFCQPGQLSTTSEDAEMLLAFDNVDLSQASRKLQVLDSVLMYAAWALVQRIHSGDQIVVFGLVSSGRDANVTGVMDMVGPCVAYFPLKIDFASLETFRDLLEAVESAVMAAHEHGHSGMSAILKSADISGPITYVDFVLQNLDMATKSSSWLHSNGETLYETGMPLTITAMCHSDRSGFRVGAEYNKSAILTEEVDFILRRFGFAVQTALCNPDTRLDSAEFLLADERPFLTDESHLLNDLRLSTLEMFCNQLDFPSRAAAEDVNGDVLSYTGLHEKSTAFASLLNSKGLVAGDNILINLEKSLELVVVLLACLKGGFW
jgi:non-ribosomal peptide synthetase component F